MLWMIIIYFLDGWFPLGSMHTIWIHHNIFLYISPIPSDRRAGHQPKRWSEAEDQSRQSALFQPWHLSPGWSIECCRCPCWTAHLHTLYQGRHERKDNHLCHSSVTSELSFIAWIYEKHLTLFLYMNRFYRFFSPSFTGVTNKYLRNIQQRLIMT